jgi:hypothetical protein
MKRIKITYAVIGLLIAGTGKAVDIRFNIEDRTGLSDAEFVARMGSKVKYVVWKSCFDKGQGSKSFLTPSVTVPLCADGTRQPDQFLIEIGNHQSNAVPLQVSKVYTVVLVFDAQGKLKILVK